jgi:Trp operon repressor
VVWEKSQHEEVHVMSVTLSENENERIEQLALNAEMVLAEDESRRELKERRGVLKQTLYDGSKKLKHMVPKGKHV